MNTSADIGNKPQIHFKPAWVFELSKADSLLVLKALGGRLTGPAEKDAAKVLCDRLTELRAQEGRAYLGSLERAAEAATRE